LAAGSLGLFGTSLARCCLSGFLWSWSWWL
jgi:hypothetical protein